MNKFYSGRLQTEAKHKILKGYLEKFAYKILFSFGSLDYVDAFCGPWKERDNEDYSDTSFAIAVDTLSTALARVRETKPDANANCVFNEANHEAFEKLKGFVDRNRKKTDGLSVHTLYGTFEDNSTEINCRATGTFRLFFIDPTGWTGFGPATLGPLARDRTEVLINFMYDHINRHLAVPSDDRNRWLNDLIGEYRAEQLKDSVLTANDIEKELKAYLKEQLGFRFVADTPIFKAESNRLHFKLIYATHSAAGVEVLREAEFNALSDYDQRRYDLKQNPQQGLLFDATIEGPFLQLRRDHLEQLKDTILDRVSKNRNGIAFASLCGHIGSQLYVRTKDIKAAVIELANEGKIHPSWKIRNVRSRTPDDKDKIKLVG